MTQLATADLCDAHDAEVTVLEPMLAHFGGVANFHGRVQTVKVFEDNVLIKAQLSTPGDGRVLVVDGGGSLRCALVGDLLAQMAIDNNWAGIVVFGAIRDSAPIGAMPIGVMALGTHPKKSIKKGAGDVGIAVTFAGQTIRPGVWLYADDDGVILADTPLH
ncbi:MAG: ribonuclease E activity regulator RraA [Burkholderiales bacterium]|jgi:regulator of ribonuclease activity A|nr:RraA family protein [Betaproteobacteria bacterium]